MFATMEPQARAHPKAKEDMPVVLEVEVGNDHARGVYVERREFEHLGFREPPGTDRRYEVLSRAATRATEDDQAEGADERA